MARAQPSRYIETMITRHISTRGVLIWAALALFGAATPVAAGEPQRPVAFVEMFTSQGCASCPAADAYVGDLSAREDVIAVSMPVKLWDFLGWRDTMATPAATERQAAYASAHGQGVYTPQAVVNGAHAMAGSDRAAIDAAIDAAADDPLPLAIALSVDDGVLEVAVSEGRASKSATLYLLIVEESVTVAVGAGENRGRRLTYHNVVRQIRPIGMWSGEAVHWSLPLSDVAKGTGVACVVILQEDGLAGPGKVLGAATHGPLFPARTIAQDG